MTQFRDNFYAFVPPWLATGNAEKYMYTLELMRDLLMEKADQAMRIRLPGQGHISQKPYLAFDRRLVQGPNEGDEPFIERIKNAFDTWNHSGSAASVLGQLQAFAQGYQADPKRQFVIVSNQRTLVDASKVNTWYTLDYSDPVGTEPLLSTVPHNFDWDGENRPWWEWLIVFQYRNAPVLSGDSAAIASAGGGSFVLADLGENVDGVWVPKSSGTPVNAPFLTVTGLLGLTQEHVGGMITISGSGTSGNNRTCQIAQVLSGTSCVIVNTEGAVDAGPLDWEIDLYPWIPPGPAWGSPGLVWGEGQETPPPIDTGSVVGGVWQPTTLATPGELPSFSWGLRVNALEIESLRSLVRTWKSAGTYYPHIVISYGGLDGEYSRTSDEGAGNPDGTFGSVGALVGGVWVPTRLLESPLTCYCQGTGRAAACSLENLT